MNSEYELQWRRGELLVFARGRIYNLFKERFHVELNYAMGVGNLIIDSVQPEDAGTYTCYGDAYGRSTHTVELIVLGQRK